MRVWGFGFSVTLQDFLGLDSSFGRSLIEAPKVSGLQSPKPLTAPRVWVFCAFVFKKSGVGLRIPLYGRRLLWWFPKFWGIFGAAPYYPYSKDSSMLEYWALLGFPKPQTLNKQ